MKLYEFLGNISILLNMDDVPFKPRAYEKAALSIEALEEDVEEIYRLDADGQPPKTSLTQERLNSLKNAEKII